ncbi:MAG: hypothetical protein K2P38_16675 [Lachnospiraceae bacterium]|nr:hypothetical protein [Lachnospiraceae bacterium]
MTDSKKLDLLLEKVTGIEKDVSELKKDMVEVKADIVELKKDVSELKKDVTVLKEEVKVMKGEIIHLHRYSDLILDEVERVHGILDMHKADKRVHTA